MATSQPTQVKLSLNLRCDPQTVSIHDPNPSTPLKLIATIKQAESPFPERAVTIMTKYSCLASPQHGEAFFSNAMESPRIITPDPQCPAPLLPLRPIGKRITIIRISGDPDLLKRPESDGFTFLTIPPVGEGHVEVVFELPPEYLLRRLGNKDDSVQHKMQRFLRPGDAYRIVSRDRWIRWWCFEPSEGERPFKDSKIARWSLPDELPLRREAGDDDTNEIARKLQDLVDHHNVNSLSSRSAVEGEQRPDVRKMRSEGWIFGEPAAGLVMIAEEEGATFTIAGSSSE